MGAPLRFSAGYTCRAASLLTPPVGTWLCGALSSIADELRCPAFDIVQMCRLATKYDERVCDFGGLSTKRERRAPARTGKKELNYPQQSSSSRECARRDSSREFPTDSLPFGGMNTST
ncbi:hypothetical protein FB45DRAFT_872003 [Roridomyces roridus]|uniref:Uncharacterized protein n=1 Tax=Roridomyces roridus TaxID=1738132 RepID=A0AAD7BE90_9AGAR|nr:hypothetical protein FB45DRAFT_872003 [Roridomyces roridus]